MPPLVLFQTQRFLSSEKTCLPAARSSPIWRQSMQMKAIVPSRQRAAAGAKVATRKRVKDPWSISPTPMSKSRWRIRADPHTWPAIGTLYGGAVEERPADHIAQSPLTATGGV